MTTKYTGPIQQPDGHHSDCENRQTDDDHYIVISQLLTKQNKTIKSHVLQGNQRYIITDSTLEPGKVNGECQNSIPCKSGPPMLHSSYMLNLNFKI